MTNASAPRDAAPCKKCGYVKSPETYGKRTKTVSTRRFSSHRLRPVRWRRTFKARHGYARRRPLLELEEDRIIADLTRDIGELKSDNDTLRDTTSSENDS